MVKNADNALRFVQFMHPGDEHRPDDGYFKSWNRCKHKRKFLVSPGLCIRPPSKKAAAVRWEKKRGELVFWGEWEPESEVVCRIARPKSHYPRYVYRPFYVVPDCYNGLQNTDPFVFGAFLYGNCLQHRKGGPTELCNLKKGSVIVFGSCLSDEFVLDTVFVVGDSIPYDCPSYRSVLKGCVPPAYMDVVLKPLFQSGCGHREGCSPDKGDPYRLYIAATSDKPIDGMFSFFPCMPRDERCERFGRPVINLRGFINGSLRQGFSLNRQVDRTKIHQLWRSVVKQVLAQGLWLGIEAEMLERRGAKR